MPKEGKRGVFGAIKSWMGRDRTKREVAPEPSEPAREEPFNLDTEARALLPPGCESIWTLDKSHPKS